MTDGKLIEDLARRLYRTDWPATRTRDWSTLPVEEATSYRVEAGVILSFLGERGLLLPKGGLTKIQWGMATPKRNQLICRVASAAEARELSAPFPRTRVAVTRRVTTWPDGTKLATPWVPLLPEPEEGTDG